jgi:hypothetical protein
MAAYLTPEEFDSLISDALGSRDPDTVARAVADALQQRYPPLAAWAADCYVVPANAALFLYQAAPRQYASLLPLALGSPVATHFGERLTAIAGYVSAASDWETVGQLACFLERAVVAAQASAATTLAATQRLLAAWSDYFEQLAVVRAPWYTHCALGYLEALPPGLAVPPDLVGHPEAEGPADGCSWRLLRLFWQKHHGAWKTVPDAVARLAAAENPFLADLAARIRTSPEERPQSPAATAAEPVAAPFAELAGQEFQSLAPPPPRPPTLRFAPRRSAPTWWERTWAAILETFWTVVPRRFHRSPPSRPPLRKESRL